MKEKDDNQKSFKAKLINMFFPKNIKCLVCDKELSINTHFCLCDKCLKSLPRNNGRTCQKCGEPIKSDSKFCLHCKHKLPVFTKSFSPLLYKQPIVSLIKGFKYDNKIYYSETLGNFLVESYVLNDLNCDVIIPVPLHEKRKAMRGYNQAELLTNQVSKVLGLPHDTTSLIRVKNTRSQTNLTKSGREENVSSAFEVTNKKAIYNKVVLIVDDVYTTGSTLNECASVLFENGAKKVYCITLAHTLEESASKKASYK